MCTELNRVDSLNSLPWSDGRDLGSKNDCAKEDIIFQRDQPQSTLGIVDRSVADKVDRVSRCEFHHTPWRDILSIVARWHARSRAILVILC